MARVAVVTDTTHYVTFDGATERESDITDLADFYTRLSSSREMPGT